MGAKGRKWTDNEGISITLRNNRGEACNLELLIQREELEHWLVSRIYRGIQNFALGLQSAFQAQAFPKALMYFWPEFLPLSYCSGHIWVGDTGRGRCLST